MSYDYFAGIGKAIANPPFGKIEDWTLQYHLRAARGDKVGAKKLRDEWQEWNIAKGKEELDWLDESLGQIFAQPKIDLNMLQPYSFYIRFTFTLRKPYLSKDDNEFYIIDNPVRKDPIFKLPMVAPTAWKGALRAALWMQEEKDNDDSSVSRLFGDAHGEDEGQQGYLFFYPTFFNRVGLEIINPHDRERRVGKKPIVLECVPKTTSGTFTLLYVPFDLIGRGDVAKKVAEDLNLVAEGVKAMFTEYGFGAKTSSGFGVAAERVKDGMLKMRVAEDIQPPWWSRDFGSFERLLEIAEDGANYMKKQEGKK